MTVENAVQIDEAQLAAAQRQYEIEDFYRKESALLDERNHSAWVELFSDDTHYFMPLRRTRNRRELDKEFTKPGEMAFFDDTKEILVGRVRKLESGTAWAEDPPSRTRHIVTNVRIVQDDGNELVVESNFHLYRTRLKSEETSWIGMRRDKLRRHEGSFLIAGRDIFLEQTLLLSRNLSNFI